MKDFKLWIYRIYDIDDYQDFCYYFKSKEEAEKHREKTVTEYQDTLYMQIHPIKETKLSEQINFMTIRDLIELTDFEIEGDNNEENQIQKKTIRAR